MTQMWREKMRSNITCLDQLALFLDLNSEDRQRLLNVPRFPLNLPFRLAAKIQKKNLNDPLLRQFVPLESEAVLKKGFHSDPIGDEQSRYTRKLLHKYQGRVLLLVTSACAVHCRFCFRQHFDYETKKSEFEEEIQYIKSDSSIHEVILSGGDPLSLSNDVLKKLLFELQKIPHLTKLRFHSRFPVAIPERIDEGFLDLVQGSRLQVYFVLHSNHPKELDEDLFERMQALRKAGAILLNHSVLLKGVNDNVPTLRELFEKLSDKGILPYYLHQLDRVKGSSHFEVPIEEGKAIMRQLATLLPGYALPQYVKEVAGNPNKVVIHY